VNQLRCTHCGTVGLEPGYVEDTGRASFGFTRWVPGFLQRNGFGVAKGSGRPRWQIDAFRCPTCAHLELFAANPL
jgi:hypothetical protein